MIWRLSILLIPRGWFFPQFEPGANQSHKSG
jgi:hypothetical protein